MDDAEMLAAREQADARAVVKACVRPDGGLYDLGWYLGWTPHERAATLDGRFTAAELRAIADHMEDPSHD